MDRVQEVRLGDQVFVPQTSPEVAGPEPARTAEERAYQSLAAMQRECDATVNRKDEQVRQAYADLREVEAGYEAHMDKLCAALKPLEDAHATLCALRDEMNLQVEDSARALQTLRQALYYQK